jgi:hypothetical protein
MNPRERLEQYLDALRGRIRTLIYARAAGAGALGVVVFTAAWVWMLNRDGFPSLLAATGRVLIIAMLAVVAFALVWLPLRKLNRKEGAEEIERRLPAQHGRIETYLDMRRRQAEGVDSPLVDLLAGDAATLAEATPVREVIPNPRIWTGGGIAAAAAALLLFVLVAGPEYWGYGTRHFLLGMSLPRDAVPLRRVAVTPGDATVRRNSDLAIRASIEGFRPDEASVFVRYDGEQAWQRAPMQLVQDSERARWEFKLYALRGPLRYYVQAENSRSSEKSVEHSIAVVDLPHIERVRLTYDYPDWTDLPPRVEETVRDIHAVQGTGVKLEVFANDVLHSPVVVVNGEQVAMESASGAATGSIQVKKAGTYRISARVADELVPLTDEYTIELVSDEKPTIAIEKPGRDWHASSIEEVPVRISANDDFRLQDVELRYAVNGGEWKKMDITRGGKEVRQDSLLKLEEMSAASGTRPAVAKVANAPSLEPGDLVSYYAVARDRTQSVQTDLFMVQVQPFERRFTQGAGAGGGGGGDNPADEQGAISERQREILLATWNLQRSGDKASRSRKQLEENAKMLAEMQTLLAQQARTLSERTRARVSLDEDARVKQFVESLERAAEVMDPAAKHLENFKLAQAIPVEQQALQQLLRAEAAFRDVQVSMQRDSSGGGAQAARSLTEMLELEMDVDKNHYETESQLAKEQKKEELNDAIRKLKELAARQEKLAQEMQRKALPEQEQRWRQEQLRREAEDLRRRLAELQRQQQNSPNSQSPSNQSPNNQNGSSQGQQSGERQGQQSSEQMANAMDTMKRALDDMRAASSEQQGSSGKSAQEASRKLQKALDQMDQPPPQGLSETLEQFASRTEKLANRQRETEADLYDAISEAEQAGRRRGQLDPQRAEKLTKTKQEMAEEVRKLQQEMRNAMNDHRVEQPESTQKLGELVSDLESTNVVTRISRSASEIQYGRARDAASREGLITDVLESLEKALHENAQLAAREGKRDSAPADPEAVLAELSELRRALQEAQRGKGQAGSQPGQGQDAQRDQQQARQQGQGPGQQQGKGPGKGQESQQQGQGEGQGQGSEQGQQQAASGQSGNPNSGGAANNGGLGAWNPGSFAPQSNMRAARSGWIGNLEPTDAAQFRRDATEVAERVRNLADRMRSADLNPAEVNALRRMAHELRSLAGDPMASQAQAMAKLVDQIELATLAAATKVRNATPAHTTSATAEEPQYREAVAEYYRRLGGS